MSKKMVPIGEVVDFIGGGTPSRDIDQYWKGGIPWASVKDFKGPSIDSTLESITHEGLSNSSSTLIPAGHVIIPTRMALGKAAINSIDVAINQDLKALKPKIQIDTRYLLHTVLSRVQEIQSHGKGATVQGITIERLRTIQIPFPPLEEQRRIAAILDRANRLAELRDKSIKDLDILKQSIFRRALGVCRKTEPRGDFSPCVPQLVRRGIDGMTQARCASLTFGIGRLPDDGSDRGLSSLENGLFMPPPPQA
jgi:type I restriction enzyme S subunit